MAHVCIPDSTCIIQVVLCMFWEMISLKMYTFTVHNILQKKHIFRLCVSACELIHFSDLFFAIELIGNLGIKILCVIN